MDKISLNDIQKGSINGKNPSSQKIAYILGMTTITHHIERYEAGHKPSPAQKQGIVDFLFTHLDEYGDPKAHILKCLDYAVQDIDSPGGFALTIGSGGVIKGAVIVNRTGMGGYIPENILVYIAVDQQYRGQGLGKVLMEKAIATAEGDIALHVEANNPAKGLYEKLGFTNPYLEMRLKRTAKND